MPTERPKRKHPARGVHINPNQGTVVFITVCTEDREPWLATKQYEALLLKVWAAADHWIVGRYVLMPDHIHFFAAPIQRESSLENWMHYWRNSFRKENPNPANKLQSGHWDTRMRTSKQYAEKWEYVRENPVRQNLATTPDDWPYRGEPNALRI